MDGGGGGEEKGGREIKQQQRMVLKEDAGENCRRKLSVDHVSSRGERERKREVGEEERREPAPHPLNGEGR